MPVSGWGCNNCDKFFRNWFYYPGSESGNGVTVYLTSDDGISLYVNGYFIGEWGAGCHHSGCINYPPWNCAIRYVVPAIDITPYLHSGANLLAIHVTEAAENEYLNVTLSNININVQQNATCCNGNSCSEIGSLYTSQDCISDGGTVYVGGQYDCADFSPCEQVETKVKSDPILFFQCQSIVGTFPDTLEFVLIDTVPRTIYYEMPDSLGGDTIYVNDFTGQMTVRAEASSHPDTINLTLLSYDFQGHSVDFMGIPTGDNTVQLDPEFSVSVHGYYVPSSGFVEVVVHSILTNNLFGAQNAIHSRSHIRGTFSMSSGVLAAGANGYSVIPGCCHDLSGNVDGSNHEGPDLSDLIYFANWLFLSGPAAVCVAEANINGDGDCVADLSDLIYLVNYLFLGGTGPAGCLSVCP